MDHRVSSSESSRTGVEERRKRGRGEERGSQYGVAEDAGQDTAGGRVQEERKVEEREEDRPARAEEQEARAVAHVDERVWVWRAMGEGERGKEWRW